MKLFNFKADGSLLIVKLFILAAAVPFLWLTDGLAFLCDLKKIKKGARWFSKGACIAFLLIASMHICENMLSELTELYVELIRLMWLGLQLIQLSSVSLFTSSCIIGAIYILIGLNDNFTNNSILSLSPVSNKQNNYPSCSNAVLPDGSFLIPFMREVSSQMPQIRNQKPDDSSQDY